LAFGGGLLGLLALSVPALRQRRRLVTFAIVLVLAALAVAIFGVVGRLLFGNRLYGLIPVPTVTPFGPFVSKNHFAGYVEMAALLALGLGLGLSDEARRGGGRLDWIESRSAWRPLLAFSAFATLALAVLLSQSRGGALSLGAGLLALPFLRQLARGRRARRSSVLLAGALALSLGGLALLALPAESRDRLATIVAARTDFSASYRLRVWRDALQATAGSPLLGFGLGTFADALPPFKRSAGELRVEHAENDYIEVLAEGGLVGFLLLLGAAGRFSSAVVRGLRSQGDRLLRGIGIGALAGLMALAVHSAGDFNLRVPSNAFLAACLACLALSASISCRLPGRLDGSVQPSTASSKDGSDLRPDTAGGTEASFGVEPGSVPAQEGPSPGVSARLRRHLAKALLVAAGTASVTLAAVLAAFGPRYDAPLLLSSLPALVSDLRSRALEATLTEDLHRTPTDARRWLALAWLRGCRGGPESVALARHAQRLEPAQPRIAAESERLAKAFSSR
jgi:O-antigen ligase